MGTKRGSPVGDSGVGVTDLAIVTLSAMALGSKKEMIEICESVASHANT
jgi:hypothetical protein